MINQAITSKLVKIYCLVSDKYETELKYHCQRFSNNDSPGFSDQEAMTIYLFCTHVEKQTRMSQMYAFIKNYFLCWFPKLPSYVAFTSRLNRLAVAFQLFSAYLIAEFVPKDASTRISVLDSMPIITCSGKREAKVANEIADKSYCATKNLYYYGVKLHALAFQYPNQIPHPESIIISKASENDLTIFKENWSGIEKRTFYADKAYVNRAFFEVMYKESQSEMLTPVKAIKDQPPVLKQWDKAANDLFSRAVSTVRQPIESFFNWLIEKTDIQRASKVRSTNGLKVHIFGKLAAAFLNFIF